MYRKIVPTHTYVDKHQRVISQYPDYLRLIGDYANERDFALGAISTLWTIKKFQLTCSLICSSTLHMYWGGGEYATQIEKLLNDDRSRCESCAICSVVVLVDFLLAENFHLVRKISDNFSRQSNKVAST